MQPVQSPHVSGQQVVLDDPPVFGPVDANDFVVVEVHPFGVMLGFAELKVGGAFGLDHRYGHAERDDAVDRPAAADEFVLSVLDGDLVAEEPCRARSGVGDQGLLLGQFQLEIVMQEPRQPPFDRLSGAADRGVRQGRHDRDVRQGPAQRQPRRRTAGAVPGHDRRVRTRPDPGTDPPRQSPPRQERHDQRALGRPVRLPVCPQERACRGPLRDHGARGGDRRRAVRPLRRRWGRDRRAGPLAERAGCGDPHRQAALGPLHRLGHAAQPRLRRAGLLRQNDAHRSDRRAQPHRPPGRARHAPPLHGHRPRPRRLARDTGARAGRRGHLAAGPAATGRQ